MFNEYHNSFYKLPGIVASVFSMSLSVRCLEASKKIDGEKKGEGEEKENLPMNVLRSTSEYNTIVTRIASCLLWNYLDQGDFQPEMYDGKAYVDEQATEDGRFPMTEAMFPEAVSEIFNPRKAGTWNVDGITYTVEEGLSNFVDVGLDAMLGFYEANVTNKLHVFNKLKQWMRFDD